MSEIGELTAVLDDSKIRLCLRILSAFSFRADGVATPGEIFNIVCNDGYEFIHYEQVRKAIADFLVPNGFVSIGRTRERIMTEKGRILYDRLRDTLRLTSQKLPPQSADRELTAPNRDNLVSQIGHLIEELSQKDRLQVLTEALRRFC